MYFKNLVSVFSKFTRATRKGCSVLAATAFMLNAGQASAADFQCFGKVGLLGVNETGDLIVSIVNGAEVVTAVHYICNVSIQRAYVTSPTACKASLDVLIAARNADKVVYITYADTPPAVSCSTISAWSIQSGARAARY